MVQLHTVLFSDKLVFSRAPPHLLCPATHSLLRPGGTAGQPILGGIESEGVSEVMVVVTRYSGGIKLGTGGLCRAYGGGSRLCLQAAERCAGSYCRTLLTTFVLARVE